MPEYWPEACYRVAGLTVKMKSYGRTVEQAEAYRCEDCENPDIVIQSLWPQRKGEYPMMDDGVGEYLCTGASFYKQLLNYDGLMLHASAVVVDGKAYLFSAPCGTGKSTHTGLWLQTFGDRAYILNDDKPALRRQDGRWYAYGTPWSGKHDISVNIGVPLAGIAMVHRGDTNEIARWNGRDAIHAVMTQVNRPRDPAFRIRLLELLDKLFREVPVWKLQCNMNPEAALVSYEAMSAVGRE